MTLTTPAAEEVIKTDVLGRKRTSAVRREGLLAEFDKSGLSAKQFAELTGIKYQTLATWLQKRRRNQISVKAAEVEEAAATAEKIEQKGTKVDRIEAAGKTVRKASQIDRTAFKAERKAFWK